MLVSFALGQALSWRGLARLGASLSLLPVPLLLLLPETPQHLTRTGTYVFGHLLIQPQYLHVLPHFLYGLSLLRVPLANP